MRMMRQKDGLLPNLLALSYATAGFVIGWVLFFSTSWFINATGIFILAHAMVIAAYLIHECAHNTIFMKNNWNANLGRYLMWLTGSSYSEYEAIRNKHFRHHVDRADVVSFNYREKLAQYTLLVKLIKWLEWLYIPAVDILMHSLVVILPFTMANRRHKRLHVLTVVIIRAAIFLSLASIKPVVLLYYAIAYMLFMHVMRFMDVHQHTYEIFETLDQPRGELPENFTPEYETQNTYSNLISEKFPWLNLLVLNFGYHNAHHEKPITPWYKLPEVHRQYFNDDERQLLPFRNLIKAYHQYRVPRILNADLEDSPYPGKGRHFIGVDGVSFLVTH